MRARAILIVGIFLTSILMTIPASAQQGPNPPTQAAIDALNEVIPDIGMPDRWSYTFRIETNTNLGCPLVPGTETGVDVTAYRVVLTYDATDYVYYVSADTTIIIPCDPDIPSDSSVPTPTASPCVLSATVNAANVRSGPSTDFDIIGNAPRSQSYPVVGRTSDDDWYRIQFTTQQQGWVGSSVSDITGDCAAVPVIESEAPTVCTLAGNGATVRQSPTLNAASIGTASSGQTYQVLGTATDGNWYYIQYSSQQGGWVDANNAIVSGDCSSLPAIETSDASSPTTNPSSGIPTGMACPVSFSGYLPPRIQMDNPTASVAEGIFLSLRSEPSAQSTVVTSLPPGAMLSQILDGPACANGIVWWQVEYEGISGWVPESNSSADVYYLEPLIESDTDRITGSNIAELMPIAELNAYTLAWGIGFLAVATTDGVQIYNYPDLELETDLSAMLAIPENIDRATTLAFSPDAQYLAVGYHSGRIRLLDLNTGSLIALAGDHLNTVNSIAINQDGLMASVSGIAPDVDPAGRPITGSLKVWDLTNMNAITGVTPISFEYSDQNPLLDVAMTPEGTLYVAVVSPTTLLVFDANSQQEFYRHDFAADADIGQVEFAQLWWLEGNWGYFFIEDESVRAVDLTQQTIVDLYSHSGLQAFAYTPFFSADEVPVMALAGDELQLSPGDALLSGQTYSLMVEDMEFSRDGSAFAFISDGQAQIWRR